MTESTKVSIVLAKPNNWWNWFNQVEDLACAWKIWHYVDPNDDDDEPIEPDEPTPRIMRINGVTTLQDVVDKNLIELWHNELWKHKKNLKTYEDHQKHLQALCNAILVSIPDNKCQGIPPGATVGQILHHLYISFKPSKQSRLHELDRKYDNLRTPHQNRLVDKWFLEWCAFLTDVDNCPGYYLNKRHTLTQLHSAVKHIMPTAAATRYMDAMEWDDNNIDLCVEIWWFECQYEFHKILSAKGNVFGTFQGLSDSPNSPNDSSHSSGPPSSGNSGEKRKVKCICGVEHRFMKCPYVNPAVHPGGWTPDSAIQAKFNGVKSSSIQNALNKV